MSTKALTKVVYQPDNHSTDAYELFVNPEELAKWKEDKTVPLIEVVDSYDIFFSAQGATGQLGKASKQQLETVFGTSKDADAVIKLLELGKVQEGKKISHNSFSQTNDSRGVRAGGAGGR